MFLELIRSTCNVLMGMKYNSLGPRFKLVCVNAPFPGSPQIPGRANQRVLTGIIDLRLNLDNYKRSVATNHRL